MVINVDLGDRVKVNEIEFSGYDIFKTNQLKKKMKKPKELTVGERKNSGKSRYVGWGMKKQQGKTIVGFAIDLGYDIFMISNSLVFSCTQKFTYYAVL